MTTSNDGFHGVAYGKFRKKVLRKMTPYDQPAISITNSNPNNTSKSGFLSRLIYLVTCAFWKRNPEEAPVTGTNEEQRNLANISTATEISNLETMPKQNTFRYDIEHLKKSLHLRTTRSDVGEGDKANIYNNSHVLRLKASTSGPLNKHTVKDKANINSKSEFYSCICACILAFEEDVTLAVELAKARSRGRTSMYGMARPPYYRGPSTLSKKFVKPTTSLISSQPAWELEGSNGSKMFDSEFTIQHISSQPAWELEGLNGSKMARKRRSSVLDDLGSGGLMCRIWQKANLCSQGSSLSEHKSEFVSSALNLLLCSEPERKASKAIVENGKTSMRNSGYAFVPTQSTQMASKILEHLERTSPKEKNSSSRVAGTTEKSANKLTSNLALGSLDKVESSKFLLSSQNNQKSEGQYRIEENGPQRFAVPLIVLSSMNGNSTARDFEVLDDDNYSTSPIQGNAPTTNAASTLALTAEPPPKKPAFLDFEVLDDDNHSTAPIQGNASTPNFASTLALKAEPQKKPASEETCFSDDDNHSTKQVQGHAPTTNAASTLALTTEPEETCFSDDDNHSTARVKGSAPTTNASSTLALRAEPRQKKPAFQMSVHEYFEVLDDDNHSTARVQGNAPTTNAASTLALPADLLRRNLLFR
ncbi:hypothetical protein Tco_1252912 [Tanacetum coccineum]